MLLLIGAAFSLAMGVFIAYAGQEQRVKTWFFLLCVSAAVLSTGLWVEIHIERYTMLAARVNMIAGLALSASILVLVGILCDLPIHRWVIVLLGTAAAVNISTALLTDLYFTGELVRYPWGIYAGGDPKFILNPLLVTVITLYGLSNLVMHYRKAHPFDKERTKFLFAAYLFLALSLLDYVPHFGIDLLGGPISGFTIPMFLFVFGYASLRYRLVEFRTALGRVTGWGFTFLMTFGAYTLVFAVARRTLQTPVSDAYVAAATVSFFVGLGLSRFFPEWMARVVAIREPDFLRLTQAFGNEIASILDEVLLMSHTMQFCTGPIGSGFAAFVAPDGLAHDERLQSWIRSDAVVEAERYRRAHARDLPAPRDTEVLVPLIMREKLLGALALGRRTDGRMYGDGALEAFRFLGNMVSMVLTNTRSAVELEKRHQLDRYLAPQLVERVLSGDASTILAKRRMKLTVFFSDLKDFTTLADTMDPEHLSMVLNEYLSEMADVAFHYGGTVDKFIGDAVMVFFGAPVDADPRKQVELCVRMAVAMHRRTVELNVNWRAKSLLTYDLTSRMGIHTGEATVGSFGSHRRVEYTVIGRAVNLASRLEEKCTPGRIFLSSQAWEYLAGTYPGESCGLIAIKGFAAPVEVFEIDPANIAVTEAGDDQPEFMGA